MSNEALNLTEKQKEQVKQFRSIRDKLMLKTSEFDGICALSSLIQMMVHDCNYDAVVINICKEYVNEKISVTKK